MANYDDNTAPNGIPDGNPVAHGRGEPARVNDPVAPLDAAQSAPTQRDRLAALAPRSAEPGARSNAEMAPSSAIATPSRPVPPGQAPSAAIPREAEHYRGSAPTPSPGPARPVPNADDAPRMRPADMPPRSAPPAPSEPPQARAPITRRARAPQAPTPPNNEAGGNRQIWDMDEASAPSTRPVSRKIKSTPLVLNTPARSDDGGGATAEAQPNQRRSGAKAKTRILGFHAQNVTKDVFESAALASEARYPAGWIVVIDGPGRGASFIVSTSVSTIGRAEDQAISLDFGDTSISRQNHASVAYDEEQNKFFSGHGGKSNVVRRNGTPVLATEELSDGDLIRIGKTTLRFVALCGPDFSWVENEAEFGDGGADADV